MKDLTEMYIPTYQDMLDAHERIKPHINRTPIRTSAYLNELVGADQTRNGNDFLLVDPRRSHRDVFAHGARK